MELFSNKGTLEKEWDSLLKQEAAFYRKQSEKKDSSLNRKLEEKIPPKLQEKLNQAFFKAFELVFEKGTEVIEKTYKKEKLEQDYKIRNYAAKLTGNSKEIKVFHKKAGAAGMKNLLISGLEGVGLGVLGIGLPDIPIFVAVILKSIYEISLNYGYAYDERAEQLYILQLVQNTFLYGAEFEQGEKKLAQMQGAKKDFEDGDKSKIIRQTSAALSKELLYMKFLQGIPIVGAVGGAYDAICLQKIIKYTKLKYKRRFLTDWSKKEI